MPPRLFALLVLPLVTGSSPQRNMLLLFPDQWRWEWTSATNPSLQLSTPAFDAVAGNGTRFGRAYVASPLCAPSRSCLALGREYDHNKVPSNEFDVPDGIPTFYRVLRDVAGYHVMITGKDDLTKSTGYNPDGSYRAVELGYSAWLGRTPGKLGTLKKFRGPYNDFLLNSTVLLKNGSRVNALLAHDECFGPSQTNPVKYRSPLACCTKSGDLCDTPSPLPDSMYEDNWVALKGLQMLSERPQGKPWFMQVNWPGPHGPFVVTESMHERTLGRDFPQPVDYFDGGFSAADLVTSRRLYTAEVENLDNWMQEYIDLVEKLGDLNNTIICISSDHGEMLGDHGDWAKSKPWEGASRVPLACKGPGIVQGQVFADQPVSTMDLAATFLDYGGINVSNPTVLDSLLPYTTSKTLRPMLEGRQPKNRDFVSSGLGRNASGVGTDLYDFRMVVKLEPATKSGASNDTHAFKYICCNGACPGSPSNVDRNVTRGQWQHLLYDVTVDVGEMNDIKTERPDLVEALRALLPTQFAKNCKNATW